MNRCIVAIGCLVAVLCTARSAKSQPTVGGFVELVQAIRVEPNEAFSHDSFGDRRYPRSEARAQLSLRSSGEREELFIRTDLVGDGAAYQDNKSAIGLREAYAKVRVADWLDIKAGRQISTWGTGDLIFANDLFAKDWVAFFTGLDDSYLKYPNDLIRVTAYSGAMSLDVAFAPYLTPDQLSENRRLTMYDPLFRRISTFQRPVIVPSSTLRNSVIFGRLTRMAGEAEIAIYGYRGFWMTPQGFRSSSYYYPRMWSVGASLQFPVGSYLWHAEIAAYNSTEDLEGDDPLVANSEIQGFVGAEKSLGNEWTIGTQYLAEWMLDHDSYKKSAPVGMPIADELRSTFALRVTKLAIRQTVRLSIFGYWGISDEDWHLRPSIGYDISDAVKWTVGGSILDGRNPSTTFGQFRGNSNVFTRLRYSF